MLGWYAPVRLCYSLDSFCMRLTDMELYCVLSGCRVSELLAAADASLELERLLTFTLNQVSALADAGELLVHWVLESKGNRLLSVCSSKLADAVASLDATTAPLALAEETPLVFRFEVRLLCSCDALEDRALLGPIELFEQTELTPLSVCISLLSADAEASLEATDALLGLVVDIRLLCVCVLVEPPSGLLTRATVVRLIKGVVYAAALLDEGAFALAICFRLV